jgi:ankyrin repeat protein
MKEAIDAGNINDVMNYATSGFNIRKDIVSDVPGWDALHYAVFKENLPIIIYLIVRGADPNGRDGEGLTPLHLAARTRRMDIIDHLISHGANVNAESVHHWTPLHEACLIGNVDAVLKLIDNGADAGVRNADNHLPVDLAKENGHLDLVRIMHEIAGRTQTSSKKQTNNNSSYKSNNNSSKKGNNNTKNNSNSGTNNNKNNSSNSGTNNTKNYSSNSGTNNTKNNSSNSGTNNSKNTSNNKGTNNSNTANISSSNSNKKNDANNNRVPLRNNTRPRFLPSRNVVQEPHPTKLYEKLQRAGPHYKTTGSTEYIGEDVMPLNDAPSSSDAGNQYFFDTKDVRCEVVRAFDGNILEHMQKQRRTPRNPYTNRPWPLEDITALRGTLKRLPNGRSQVQNATPSPPPYKPPSHQFPSVQPLKEPIKVEIQSHAPFPTPSLTTTSASNTDKGSFISYNKKRYKLRVGDKGGQFILVKGKRIYMKSEGPSGFDAIKT